MKALEKFIAWTVLSLVAMLANGFVIMKLWAWFLTTTFGFEQIRIIEALGLMLLFRFLTYPGTLEKEKTETTTDYAGGKIAETILKALVILCIGWIIRLFI